MSNYNDYYERYSDDGEKKQSANFKSTDETAATYRDDGKPAEVAGSERLRVCRHCGTIHKKKYRECENCRNTLSSPMPPDEAEKLSDEILSAKGISKDLLNNKGEKRLRTFCLIFSVVSLIISCAAFVLARVIEVDRIMNDLATPYGTAFLLVANVIFMPLVFMLCLAPEKLYRSSRSYRRNGICGDIGILVMVIVFPLFLTVVGIINIISIVNAAYHLF